MPSKVLKPAIKEAYATAISDDPELETFEIYHPNANAGVPYYLVADLQDHTLRLEDASLKLFKSCAIGFTLPPTSENAPSRLQLMIDNTDQRIGDFFEAARDSNVKIIVKYRPYLLSDPDTPQYDPPLTLTLTDAIVTNKVVATCNGLELLNRPFPGRKYTRKDFPGLANL